ncbi:hypothetical protein PV433_10480 [Paenibacillus sp. GYB004]|uniref:hypothetical protein n=1 Tax=Paenibacillus sp. GYB004 TaxID=2994393 RepID=UPI002F962BD0
MRHKKSSKSWKRESIWSRYQRNRLALGRITKAEHNAEIALIDERFGLTEKERLAYDLYIKVQAEKHRRRSKR